MNNLKRKFAWGITGSGDEIQRILETMKVLKKKYPKVETRIYVSKSGEQVLKWYRLLDNIKQNFERVHIESNSNNPFLAGEVQSGKFDFLLVAPTTSNSTAKIALGIADTMITNSVNMAIKARIPVYLLPCEIGEEETVTILPNGKELKLKIRDIDSKYIQTLEKSGDIHVLRSIEDIRKMIENYYR
jgi:archaeoflavoprotein AfpA